MAGSRGKSSALKTFSRELYGPGDDLHRALRRPVFDRHVALGQQARQLDERLARDDNRTVTVDLRVERRSQRELHVGGGERDRAALGGEQDSGEHLHGASRRDGTRNEAELRHELVARNAELHPGDLHSHLGHRPILCHLGSHCF